MLLAANFLAMRLNRGFNDDDYSTSTSSMVVMTYEQKKKELVSHFISISCFYLHPNETQKQHLIVLIEA